MTRYDRLVGTPSRVVADQVRHAVLTAYDGTGAEPAVWYSTTVAELDRTLPGASPDVASERRVSLIVVKGDFTIRFARVPYRAAPPHFGVLVFVFDWVTGQMFPSVTLLLRHEPVLAGLGSPRPFRW
jgi:hypothetical protein